MLTGVSNVAEVCVEQVVRVVGGDQVDSGPALSGVAVLRGRPGVLCGAPALEGREGKGENEREGKVENKDNEQRKQEMIPLT